MKFGKKGVAITIIAVALIVAVTLIATSFLLAQSTKVAVGDFVEYKATTSYRTISQTGSVRYEVTEVSDDFYMVKMTPTNLSTMTTQTYTRSIDKPVGLSFEVNVQMVGEETISTAVGTRTVNHYTNANSSNSSYTYDYYVDKQTGVILLATMKGSSGVTVELSISSTNIKGLQG